MSGFVDISRYLFSDLGGGSLLVVWEDAFPFGEGGREVSDSSGCWLVGVWHYARGMALCGSGWGGWEWCCGAV